MGRPSNREARRAEILAAFARVLADHGYAGATVAAAATKAEVAPRLNNYHFADKEDLLASLLSDLGTRPRKNSPVNPVRDSDKLALMSRTHTPEALAHESAAKHSRNEAGEPMARARMGRGR